AQLTGQVAEHMRAGDEPHVRVARVRVVDRPPHRDRLRGRQRPVARVMLPGPPLAVTGHLAQRLRTSAHHDCVYRASYLTTESLSGSGRSDRVALTLPCRRWTELIEYLSLPSARSVASSLSK